MQHCAFVVTAERFREVEARVKSHGIDYIGPIAQLSGLLGIYFYEPNGLPAQGRRGTRGNPLHHPDKGGGARRTRDHTGCYA
jgi:hypothetical protein